MVGLQEYDPDVLLKAWEGGLRAESEGALDSPSSTYYWSRKRGELRRLLGRNLGRLDGVPSLFVDAGCGAGRDIFSLRPLLGGWRFKGFDIDADSLVHAEARKAFHQAEDVEFFSQDITARFPLEDGAAGLILSSEVAEHLPDPESYLTELRRIAKPGGFLLFTTPNEPNVFQRSFWSKRRRERLEQAHQNRAPREKGEIVTYGHISLRRAGQWDKALRGCGWELVEAGRGSPVDQSRGIRDKEAFLALVFVLQTVLDLLPRRLTRLLSDDVIALYRAV